MRNRYSPIEARYGFSVPCGLFLEGDDPPALVCLEDAEARRILDRNGDHRDSDVGVLLTMVADELVIVHPVEMVACQNEDIARFPARDPRHLAANRIRRPLVPVGTRQRLFRRKDLDIAVAKDVELIGSVDVAMEGCREKLGEDKDTRDARVDAIADRDVEQPVLAADGDGGLGPLLGQWVEAGSAPAAEHNRKYILA
jgi:hypothetical protein